GAWPDRRGQEGRRRLRGGGKPEECPPQRRRPRGEAPAAHLDGGARRDRTELLDVADARREGGREFDVVNFEPRRDRALRQPEPQQAVGCRVGDEIAMAPFGQRFAGGGADRQHGQAEGGRDGLARAGRSIEEDGRSGDRREGGEARVHQIPPAPSASARPSPTAELGRLESARTSAIASKPASVIELTASRQTRSLTVVW